MGEGRGRARGGSLLGGWGHPTSSKLWTTAPGTTALASPRHRSSGITPSPRLSHHPCMTAGLHHHAMFTGYVALTRQSHHLVIGWPSWSKALD